MNRTKAALTLIVTVLLLSQAAIVMVSSTDASDNKEELSTVDLPETTTPGEYPSKLDLRDKGLVTSVKNQGNYGTCWAHSAISCIETSIISKGYADNTIDLSELQLAYYLCNMSSDEMNGNEGDKVNMEFNFLDCGGECFTSTFVFSNWRGIVLESDVPYTSADPNMTLDPSLEYSKDKYVLSDALWINSNDRNAAKAVLNSGNSLVVNYYASDDDGYNTVTVEGKRVVTYYSASNKIANHAVTIIGYDDDFPASYFKTSPAGNGAWLIKNSWGTSTSKVDDTGCFWLSYYDTTYHYFEFLDAVPASEYDHNYQYDGGLSQHQNITYDGEAYMSNIFKTANNEDLKAVSFYTYDSEVDYTICVYTSVSAGNPTSGKLAGTVIGHAKYAGYHTIPIDTISMTKGTSFSVVIKLSGDKVQVAIDTTVDVIDEMDMIKWAESKTEAKTGQSFVSSDGKTWSDISADGMSNVRVKAFTTDSTNTASNTAFIVLIAVITVISVGAIAYYLIKRH